MATVSNVTFAEPQSAGSGKVQVQVGYTVNFDADELGKAHQIAVQLLGQDKAGDEEVPKPFVKPQVLHKFTFGLSAVKFHTPAAATFTDVVSAVIAADKLNEDPGVTFKQINANDLVPFPNPDEVYARVTVSRVSEGFSPAVTMFA